MLFRRAFVHLVGLYHCIIIVLSSFSCFSFVSLGITRKITESRRVRAVFFTENIVFWEQRGYSKDKSEIQKSQIAYRIFSEATSWFLEYYFFGVHVFSARRVTNRFPILSKLHRTRAGYLAYNKVAPDYPPLLAFCGIYS